MTEPLRLDLVVACPVEHAFDVWANRIDTWWPQNHTSSGEPESLAPMFVHLASQILEMTPRPPKRNEQRHQPEDGEQQ